MQGVEPAFSTAIVRPPKRMYSFESVPVGEYSAARLAKDIIDEDGRYGRGGLLDPLSDAIIGQRLGSAAIAGVSLTFVVRFSAS